MKAINIQIIETAIILVSYIVLYFIVKTVVNNFLKKTRLERSRRKMAIRAVKLFTTIAAIILLTGVWGFKQNEIALFASTILTALGIAFFAKWSLLSNITAEYINVTLRHIISDRSKITCFSVFITYPSQ